MAGRPREGELLGMALPIAAGRYVVKLAELPAEMLYVIISTVLCDLAHGLCRGDELVLGAL